MSCSSRLMARDLRRERKRLVNKDMCVSLRVVLRIRDRYLTICQVM